MQQKNTKYKTKLSGSRGFSLVEIVVAAGIISFSLVSIIGIAGQALAFSQQGLDTYIAGTLLEEGAEAVRSVRDTSWLTIQNLSPLPTTYYPSFCPGGAWTLLNTTATASPPCTQEIVGNFTRTISVAPVSRDTNDNIVSSGGTLDTGTKLVTVTVSWQEHGVTMTKTLSFYLLNIFS